MADGQKPNPRFRPPSPRQAAKTAAAIKAALSGDGGPAFGVHVTDPNAPKTSLFEKTRAAYAEEPADPRAMPMPAPVNWLASLRPSDIKKAPKGMRNWLVSMVKSVARDPVTAMMPLPKGGLVAKEAARASKLRAYPKARAAFDSDRMARVNRHLAETRTPFAQGLQEPPPHLTPTKRYVTEQRGRGVDVVDEVVGPPDRITLEQAQAAGITGPEAHALPPYRFTRTGPRMVEIHN